MSNNNNMLTILVTNSKGGCGKTTIATNLAGAFARANFKTALADCDRQKSSLGWVLRRPGLAAEINAVDWTREIAPLPLKTERLVIDAPAALKRKRAEELVCMADVVLLPVLPSVFDENATRKFLRLLDEMKSVRKGERMVAVIGNRLRLHTKTAERLDDFLKEVGQRAIAGLRDSQVYGAAAMSGLSLFDYDDSRTMGFLQDWRPLLSYIDKAVAVRHR